MFVVCFAFWNVVFICVPYYGYYDSVCGMYFARLY